jgi:hypothetical protein
VSGEEKQNKWWKTATAVGSTTIVFFLSSTRPAREQMCCFLCRLYFSEPLTIYVTNGENKPKGQWWWWWWWW